MGDTPIQWTDKTWNPVRGCSRVSPGCVNCYAERQAARFSGERHVRDCVDPGAQTWHWEPGPFAGFVTRVNGHAAWTGKVELIESKLEEPLHWRKPCKVFVNSMSDLFHEALDDEAISAVFAIMSRAPQHTFQILTKRPKRMLDWFSRSMVQDGVDESGCTRFGWCHANVEGRWPLPNVWLGVSAEDQQRADERIPLLLQTAAAVRFVSYEPAIGPVDFDQISITVAPGFFGSPLGWHHRGQCHKAEGIPYPRLDWIIVGGESGPGARTFDIQWARNTLAQCKAAGVACFVKQLGKNPVLSREADNAFIPDYEYRMEDSHGGDMAEWPSDLRIRQFPGEAR